MLTIRSFAAAGREERERAQPNRLRARAKRRPMRTSEE